MAYAIVKKTGIYSLSSPVIIEEQDKKALWIGSLCGGGVILLGIGSYLLQRAKKREEDEEE